MLLSSYQQLPVWRLDPVGCWRNTHNFFECLSWVCVCDSQWRKVLVFQCWTRRTSWVCVCVRVIIFTPSKGVAVMCSAWLCWRIPHSWMMHSKLLFLIVTNFDLRVRMDGKRWKSGLLEMIQFMSLGNWAGVQFFLPTTYLAQSPVSTCCLLFVCVDWLLPRRDSSTKCVGGERDFTGRCYSIKPTLNSFWLKETNGCHVTHELGFITSDILVNVVEAIFFPSDSILNAVITRRRRRRAWVWL